MSSDWRDKIEKQRRRLLGKSYKDFDLDYSNEQKEKVLNDFEIDLNNHEGIFTESDKKRLKHKYTINNVNFYSKLGLADKIAKRNNSIISKERKQVFNEFKEKLRNCDKLISESQRKKFEQKYDKSYYSFYLNLGMDDLIDKHNLNILDEENKILLADFKSLLDSQESYVDKNLRDSFRNQFNKDYYSFYDEKDYDKLVDKHNKKILDAECISMLNDFKSLLDSQESYVDKNLRDSFRNQFNKDYYSFYDEKDYDKLVDKHNKKILDAECISMLNDFKSLLDSNGNYVDRDMRESFRDDFNKDYYSFYDELDFNKLVDKHNNSFIAKFKKNIENKYISNSERLKLGYSLSPEIDLDAIIEEHNENFIKEQSELNKEYFENIAGKTLDSYQIRAVLTDDDNTQIVAGAGTGKTLTLQAKVKYLIEKQGISPSEILCISFSNSARDDLARKLEKTLGGNIVDVRTFHSIGYKILGMNDDNRDVPNGKLDELIDYFFKDIVVEKPELVKNVIEFFGYYYDIIYLNQNNLELETLKSKLNRLDEFDEYLQEQMNINISDEKEEYVNSIHELIVANYLFIHNVNYEPKKELIYDSDEDLMNNSFSNFYLPENDIYINLLNFKPNWKDTLENTKENLEHIQKVDDLIQNSTKKIINIHDYGEDIESILSILENELLKYKVDIDELSYDDLFNLLIIEKNLIEYKNFIKTVKSFINLFKGNAEYIDEEGNNISQLKFDEYKKENSEIFFGSLEKRNNFFLELIHEIYKIYTDYIDDYDYIDFDDMINDAVIALKKGAKIDNYKYIIVDEYQDTSHTRYNLLKEMQISTGAKIVVVGDDWQSIYGFTGCDVSLFSNFEKYFENPKMVKIEVTYRNSQNLIDVAGDFIQENKKQIPKKLISAKKSAKKLNIKPIKLVGYVSRAEKVLSLINILDQIAQKNEDAKILILGRNNNDKYELSCKEIFSFIEDQDYTKIIYTNYPKLNIEFRTVHKAKGLEADYVMVLNLTDKLNGFPNKMLNDPVLEFVSKKNDENISYPEERRLFYVALTRTENDVYLFHNDISPSIFIDEIKHEDKVKNLKFVFSNDEIHKMNLLLNKKYEVIGTKLTCPKCNAGEIILIVNNEKGTSGFKCSNGCGWNGGSYHNVQKGERARKLAYLKYAKVCEWCNHMVLVTPRKKNPEKKFMGCNYFPKCNRSYSLPKDFVDIDKIITELNVTRNDVYYLYKYVPVKKLNSASDDEIEIRERILTFKDGDDETVISSFTNELMEAISLISKTKIRVNIKKIVLVCVPSSKVSNRYKSTMRKSINIIEKLYKSGIAEHNFGCNKVIINQKDLLKRIADVPTAHLGEGRANCHEHVNSIECDGECLCDDDTVYIILDDITTSGASMKAAKQILINNNVKKDNIFALTLGSTVGDYDEEI